MALSPSLSLSLSLNLGEAWGYGKPAPFMSLSLRQFVAVALVPNFNHLSLSLSRSLSCPCVSSVLPVRLKPQLFALTIVSPPLLPCPLIAFCEDDDIFQVSRVFAKVDSYRASTRRSGRRLQGTNSEAVQAHQVRRWAHAPPMHEA